MSKPLWFRGKALLAWGRQVKRIRTIIKSSNILFFAFALIVFALVIILWDSQTTAYAHAFVGTVSKNSQIKTPLFEKDKSLFESQAVVRLSYGAQEKFVPAKVEDKKTASQENFLESLNSSAQDQAKNANKLGLLTKEERLALVDKKNKSGILAEKIYGMVGQAPIKEMVPFISKRDERVAAFLVGIAKKESSFGLASPSKDGTTCYNYWGYKGSGGRGTGMGYACFASAEEAIKVVGDRIEVLVNKERNTPARMVDTWKCGKSCAGDPGAPGWTSTVALYFDQLVSKNS